MEYDFTDTTDAQVPLNELVVELTLDEVEEDPSYEDSLLTKLRKENFELHMKLREAENRIRLLKNSLARLSERTKTR